MRIKNTVIRGETIELPKGESVIVGPDVRFENCKIRSRSSSRDLTLFNVKLVDCEFVSSVKLANVSLCGVSFDRCSISGTFSGCSFGLWPEYFSDPVEGDVIECDFSSAVLDSCRFMRCELEGTILPTWPCFTILSPSTRKEELLSVGWQDDVGFLIAAYCDAPNETVAICGHANSIVKKYGGTEEALRRTLGRFDFVRL